MRRQVFAHSSAITHRRDGAKAAKLLGQREKLQTTTILATTTTAAALL